MSERTKIDARGAFCPGPLMELIAAIKIADIGDEIEIWSADKGSATDIPLWTDKVGHEMIESNQVDDYWSIVVKKKK